MSRYRRIFTAQAGVSAFLALCFVPADARAGEGNAPERAGLFSSTWLGDADGQETATIAVSWKGNAPARIEVFEDRDEDGELGKDDRVVLKRVVEPGIQAVPVPRTHGRTNLRLRWRGDDRTGFDTLGAATGRREGCEWQPGFSVGDLDGPVRAMAVWDDGDGPALYVGGSFDFAGGLEVNGIAKWDGRAWSSLSNPSATGVGGPGGRAVLALAVWNDGGGEALYVAGNFQTAGGVAANRLAKWNGFTWSAVPGLAGVSGTIETLAVWDDGSGSALYAGGYFNLAGGVQVNHIAKWDGGSWSALGSGTSSRVAALAVWGDGSGETALYVGGDFTHAGGIPLNYIAKWNGAGWSPLLGPSAPGVSGPVQALAVWDDGGGDALYAGGYFTTAGGVTVNRVAKWTLSEWSALSGPFGTGVEGEGGVTALWGGNAGAGEGLHVGGYFAVAGGVAVENMARWDGAGWSTLGGTATSGFTGYFVHAITPWNDGAGLALFVGGDFGAMGDVPAGHVARWNGVEWSALAGSAGSGTTPYPAEALVVWDDGSGQGLYAAGQFTTAGGVIVNGIAKWDGEDWSTLSGPAGTGLSGPGASSLAVWDDGSGEALYAGGSFTTAGGLAAARLARWNGSEWSALPGGGTDASVLGLAVWDDGNGEALYAGGAFTSAGGAPAPRIARWNGSAWSPLSGGTGPDNYVWALLPWDDGTGEALYVGGSFTTVDGVPANHIARWNGSTWSALGPGLTFEVRALAVWDDGSGEALYAGGGWLLPGGNFGYIAKWDGSSWSGLAGPAGTGMSGAVARLTVWDNGSGAALHAAGPFATAGGVTVNGLARWDGTQWSALSGPAGTGLGVQGQHGRGSALAGWDSGSGPTLYASGAFSAAGGLASSELAAYRCPVDPLLFTDGFESGDTTAWSARAP